MLRKYLSALNGDISEIDMNLFELFGKITHPSTRRGWVETTAHFTGEANHVYNSRINSRAHYPKLTNVPPSSEINEYAIKYFAEDKERIGWYLFYPGPEPDPEEIKGTSIKIRYMKKRPWIFECIDSG